MPDQLEARGYAIVERAYSAEEIAAIKAAIAEAGIERAFGVREILRRAPRLIPLIFTDGLRELLHGLLPSGARVIRSIYFDKPPDANWIVNWHQDLTVNLAERENHPGFVNWRSVRGHAVVQPPVDLLQRVVTVRIHLDACTEANGALRVIPGSHTQGIVTMKDWQKTEPEEICVVPEGGLLLMKPLTLHASRRTENARNRRVIHLECTDAVLPGTLRWNEAVLIP
ncbi:phytanoyl-CoA dioxygenase family protein [Lewinella sp. IMCC34191]|uniref:phytanoyl-CoA dioxygenase family protein n=1 Tax=Lewinella sp. IMCC34191 TaxID=2259172 RepID=UPI000E24F66E|nr:phytanoyl-CoA dioxygenase family protein [Lewinella sp. IMCC34191]